MRERSLAALRPGEGGTVQALETAPGLTARLEALGLLPGAEVLCLMKGPFGSPAAYLVRGAAAALRQEDAARVLLLPHPEEAGNALP